MNRRYFLMSAASAGAASFAGSPADRVTLAIMGVHGRGKYLTGRFSAFADVDIACFCEVDDVVLPNAVAVLKKAGRRQPKVVKDLRRVLDDKSVDALVIATPDHWHGPATILACDAGKDVYVEKPLCHNIREGRLMIEASRRNRRIVQVGTQARSRPCIVRAMEWVHSGKLGKVLAVKAWNVQGRDVIGRKPDTRPPDGLDWDAYVGPAPFIPFNENRFHRLWRWNWNFGTGDIGNDGIHQIDMALWALKAGYPKAVVGMGRKMYVDDDQQTPDTMNLTYDYGDRIMLFEMRDWNPYMLEGMENGVAVYGDSAMIQIGELEPRVWGFRVCDRKGKEALRDMKNEDDTHQRDFVDCVRSRRAPRGDLETAHISSLYAHLGNIIARTGEPRLRFDARTETIAEPEARHLVKREYRRHWATPRGV